MTQVVLVQMPFAGVERPSIALGLISAALKAAAITTRSIYANIDFSERVGLDVHRLVEQAPLSSLIGEWIFSEAAFGKRGHVDEQAQHLKTCARDLEPRLLREALKLRGLADGEALLQEVREAASEFVETLAPRLLNMGPRVVGCTSMFQQHIASLALLREIKRSAPDVVTVIGGANCAGIMGLTTHRAFDWIDYTVTGEIDAHIATFFASLLAPPSERAAARPLPNVLSARHRGPLEQAFVPAFEMTMHMDSVETPDYDDYFESVCKSPIGRYIVPTLQFESSRGCWWGVKQHCTFCGLNANGMTYRLKSADKTKLEIEHLTSRYGLNRLSAVDNIIDHRYFQTLLPDLANDDKKYEIFYETKANLKRDQVKMLARSGVRWIQPGIESLHDETLRLIRKGTTAAINVQLLKHCLEFGVRPTWNLLVGVLGERAEWLTQITHALPLLSHLPPPQGAGPVRFDRFSPYFEDAARYGLLLQPFHSYRKVYPLDDSALRNIAYYFEDCGGASTQQNTDLWEAAYRSLERAIRQWQELFWGDQRPALICEDRSAEIIILDSRPATPEEAHVLTGIQARIYRLMDSPTTEAGLLSGLRASGECAVGPHGLSREVSELVARGLVWRTDTRLVALAVSAPEEELPSAETPPWGTVDLGAFFADRWGFLAWKHGSLAR